MKGFLQIAFWSIITIGCWVLAILFIGKGLYIGIKNFGYFDGMKSVLIGVVFSGAGVGLVDQWNKIWVKRKDYEDEDFF